MEWFVSQSGVKTGPFATGDMVAKVVRGELESGALVWREGLTHWQPLSVHFPEPQRKNAVVGNHRQHFPDKDNSSSGPQNPLTRYWSGDYSLGISFWVSAFFGSLLLAFLYSTISTLLQGADFEPFSIFAYLGGTWLTAASWAVLQFVGTWRSARKYKAQRRAQARSTFWGVAAQVAIVCGVAATLVQLIRAGAPQLSEAWQMAFEGDPRTPAYILRTMRNGAELEVAGGVRYGLTEDIERLIRTSPAIRVLHLNSVGGRLGEAKKLARLVRERGLITYTSSECLSACTIAFAAGRERWLSDHARLGYHTGVFAGKSQQLYTHDLLVKAGLPDSFATKAVSYGPDRMWYPTVGELLAAKAISGVVDSYRFAASGYGLRPDTQDFEAQLRKHSYFRAIEDADPDRFAALVSRFGKAYAAGQPEGIILDSMRDEYISPLLVTRLAKVNDALAGEFALLMADQLEWIGKKDARLCYDFASKGANTTIVNALSVELKKRELELAERLLRSRAVNEFATQADVDLAYSKVRERLERRFSSRELDLLASSEVKPSQYGKYCEVMSAMFREIGHLQPSDVGNVIRDIHKPQAGSSSK